MKQLKLLLILAIVLNIGFIKAQTSGIAVQGIARNSNNTARSNENITLTFEIYYQPNTIVYKQDASLVTDTFGVFSYDMDVIGVDSSIFANQELRLKISEGSTVISDEVLKQVPYAISASNGVPTGAIMPYVGATVPDGWLLCDGSTILNTVNTKALRDLLGTNATPNLQGMFLRGTGTSPVNNQSGPVLKGTQNDEFKAHLHDGDTDSAGKHNHDITGNAADNESNGDTHFSLGDNVPSFPFPTLTVSEEGNHIHSFSTEDTGGNETRPVNYGVNYIIKL